MSKWFGAILGLVSASVVWAAPEDAKLLFNIQGKGSSLAYDAGAFKESFKAISAIRKEEVVLSANSGGSIVAAFLTCHGISEKSVAQLRSVLVEGTPKIKASVKELRDTAENYGLKMVMISKGKVPYIPIKNLDAYVEAALGIDDISKLRGSNTCAFKIPFVIVAGNFEVVHNIHPEFSLAQMDPTAKVLGASVTFKGLFEKQFSTADFSMAWAPATLKKLAGTVATAAGLEAFRRTHPDLRLEKAYIGRACTYFASRDMYDVLQRVPEEERLCDLRLTDDAESLALAIRASAGEPTYFAPIADPNPAKLLLTGKGGQTSTTVNRSYWGGFVMPMVAQDIRRALPHLRVLGSGWTRFSDMSAKALANLIFIDSNVVAKASEYWADLALVPPLAYRNQISSIFGSRPSLETEFKFGEDRAKECFALERAKGKRCLPESDSAPAFDTPVSPSAEFPADDPLETKRGLGDLLDS